VPVVPVEVGRRVTGIADIDAHLGQVLGVLHGQRDNGRLRGRIRNARNRELVTGGVRPGSDLRIVVYTAAPGSDDESRLKLLAVTGVQLLDS
jgi:hypothetical protein